MTEDSEPVIRSSNGPPIDRIVFRPITDDATRLSALRAGEIDILTRTPSDALDALVEGGYTVHRSGIAGLLFLVWNFRNKFVQVRAVRQAVISAIDREGWPRRLLKGYARQ